jgi:hypothetical protein
MNKKNANCNFRLACLAKYNFDIIESKRLYDLSTTNSSMFKFIVS